MWDFLLRCHNPYFSRWFSAILWLVCWLVSLFGVTILILVDGFLQLHYLYVLQKKRYMSQSLFQQMVFCNTIPLNVIRLLGVRHNPYFSRWFSAMAGVFLLMETYMVSQSLFQQMVFCNITYDQQNKVLEIMSQSLFQQMVFCNGIS